MGEVGVVYVRTFYDQEESRNVVLGIASRFACDALALIDGATGEDGGRRGEVEFGAEYAAFRAWLGPELVSLAQASVVGPLLERMGVDEKGRVHISPGGYEHRRQIEAPDRLSGRVSWLVMEIPSLIEAYGELYEDEVVQASSDVEEAMGLDPEREGDRGRLFELMAKLEKWYLFSHPGARLFRNDPDAYQAALRTIARSRIRIEEITAERARMAELMKPETDVEEEDKEEVLRSAYSRMEEISMHLKRTKDKIYHLECEREDLKAKVDSLTV